jgi:FKBP-type peptidyl-prolyl cis-trans isomerase FklB
MQALIVLCLFLMFSLSAARPGRGAPDPKMEKYLKRTGAKYLAEVAKKDGAYLLKSGMVVEILKTATEAGAKSPTQGDSCDVTYSGTLKDGTPFDKGTTSFAPNQVIKGWTEAMQLMAEGDKWKLHIPYDLAYGASGSPPKIGPFAPLVFEIEIHKVKSGGKPASEARQKFQEALAPKEEL